MNKNVSLRKTYRNLILISLIFSSWLGLKQDISRADKLPVFLGQGQMCGAVSQTSAILQSRLTPTVTLDSIGNLLGASGIGRFELATNPNFTNSFYTKWIHATPDYDYIIKTKVTDLQPGTRYYYRLQYGKSETSVRVASMCTFRTHAEIDIDSTEEVSFVVVTGMNHYYFHYGRYDTATAYKNDDKHLGYPALAAIQEIRPDFFVGTGDNVYFDVPNAKAYNRSIEQGKHTSPSSHGGQEVLTEMGMRKKYHEQFAQPRFIELFASVPTYWEKDDHDYRVNDCDPHIDFPISHTLGVRNFREQLPVVDPTDEKAETYRTYQVNSLLQIWLVEGRDFRSANAAPDGPEKVLWGQKQLAWLKETLIQSTATFKILISPTPMIGPDDVSKRDNHANINGFRYERDMFFSWLLENSFLQKRFYIICGDRHWQYHSVDPTGFEEFSCGALVDANSRIGRKPGDKKSTDPDAQIKQPYFQDPASGGFLKFVVTPDPPRLEFIYFDESGSELYRHQKE